MVERTLTDQTASTSETASTDKTASTSETAGGVRPVKSAARTVDILEFLASRQNRPARLREMSQALGVPKSSLYSLLRTLMDHGWVRTDMTGTLYGIGIRALMAGTSYLDADPYLRLVQPWLDELKQELDETVHFGRLDGPDIVYLSTRKSTQYLRRFSRVGRRLPASATALGKALLACRDDDLAGHLYATLPQLTAKTIDDVEVLRKDLQVTRQRGYSVDDEENTMGVTCFGFALRYADLPFDAISCSVPVDRLTTQRRDAIVAAMSTVRTKIERLAPSLLDSRDVLLPAAAAPETPTSSPSARQNR